MIMMETVKRKTGCSDECRLEITEDGIVKHNGSRWEIDVAAYMDPAYNGQGWLSRAMDLVTASHDDPVISRKRTKLKPE